MLVVFTLEALVSCPSCEGDGYLVWPVCCPECAGQRVVITAYASAREEHDDRN